MSDQIIRLLPWEDGVRKLSNYALQYLSCSPHLVGEFCHFIAAHKEWPVELALSKFYLLNGGADLFAKDNSIRPEACSILLRGLSGGRDFLGTPEIPLDQVGYHEAGHAVIGLHFGRQVPEIEVWTNHGVAKIDIADESELNSLSENIAREELLIAQAGVAAQCRYLRLATVWLPDGTINSVRANLVTRARSWPMDNFELIDHLIATNWKNIELTAAYVLENGRIRGEELIQLLR